MKGLIDAYVNAHYKNEKKPDAANNPETQIHALFARTLSLSTLIFTVCVVDLAISILLGNFPIGSRSRETDYFEGI